MMKRVSITKYLLLIAMALAVNTMPVLANAEGIFFPGEPWTWGANWNGQLGDGSTTQSSIPVAVIGLTDVVAVAGGESHSLALESDGTVWAWGNNSNGQLGNGTWDSSSTPVAVNGLTGVVSVTGGVSHSLALKSNGTVWAWGRGHNGELGDGTTNSSLTPVMVINLTDAVAIAAGNSYSLALKSDGTVWAWGHGGMLGDGTWTERLAPVQVKDPNDLSGFLTGVVAIAAEAESHSLALKSDGTVWAWGNNISGQLGDGTTTTRLYPVQVEDPNDLSGFLTGVVAIAGGHYHSLALKSDDTVWAWGANYFGQLGNGTTTQSSIPVAVIGLNDVVAIAGSITAEAESHSLALKSDGTVWAWGANWNGQLGDGTISSGSSTPVLVIGLTDVGAIAAGGVHSLALLSGPDNLPPLTSDVSAVTNPVAINTPFELTAIVDDSETGNSNVDSAEYSIDEGAWNPMGASDGAFDSPTEEVSVTSLSFLTPGVYKICVHGTDEPGNTGESECIFIAAYDPDGGFVTGGGWIDSPEGACKYDACTEDTTGKANFGFVSKYKKGASTPTGQTEFQFKAGNLNFHSESYQWLVIVVAGPKAMFKGDGTINGEGNYGFKLMAIDEALTPSIDVDQFRIKIWDKDNNDAVVYDNEMGMEDDADPTTAIGGGSIKIHKSD